MSNSRSLRRRLAANKAQRKGTIQPKAWKDPRAPTLGTVRRWMRQAEADGLIERKGVERTGKPGRPATLWGVTESE